MSVKEKKLKVTSNVPKPTLKQRLEPFWFLLPFIIGVGLFTLYPLVNVFLMSFKEGYKFLTGAFSSWGLKNYEYVINDKYFIQAMGNTFKYVLVVVPISTVISIIIANLLNQKIKGMAIFHTAYFLPLVTSVTAVGLTWKFMFNYDYGIINWLLSTVGIEKIKWLTETSKNFSALAIYGVWSMLPFTIILLLSGLQNIDEKYYTAAKVDGAKDTTLFFRITVPLLAPTIGLTMIVNTISGFKVFNELFPLFNGSPGVAYNLFTVVYYIFYQFRGLTPPKYGRAAAAAVILFAVIFIFTMIELWIQRKWKHY